jgi:hypothetical protein
MRKKLRHFQKRGGEGKILHPRSQIPPKNGCFTVLVHCYIQWIGHSERISDRSDVAKDSHMLVKTLTESFTGFGKDIKQSFSDHAPASIDYAVIVSNIHDL